MRLDRVTLDGHAGKLYRQILRRGERDRLRFRVLRAVRGRAPRCPSCAAISDDWLAAKGQRERQFSIGFFDDDYLRRFPCAIVEEAAPAGADPRVRQPAARAADARSCRST